MLQAAPEPIHYLPIATTLVAGAFFVRLAARWRARRPAPHLFWWAFGVFAYGLGTALESAITLAGNGPWLNKAWYAAGAVLGGYPLAQGSVWYLARARTARLLTAVSAPLVAAAVLVVLASPVDAAALESHRPGGAALGWSWVRLCTPFINGYAAIFLIGGAAWSAVRYARGRAAPQRALGNGLIAFGALLPGIGGGMAKAGIVEGLYVGEFLGLLLIWGGSAITAREPAAVSAAASRSLA